jgi:hypothetical protein
MKRLPGNKEIVINDKSRIPGPLWEDMPTENLLTWDQKTFILKDGLVGTQSKLDPKVVTLEEGAESRKDPLGTPPLPVTRKSKSKLVTSLLLAENRKATCLS